MYTDGTPRVSFSDDFLSIMQLRSFPLLLAHGMNFQTVSGTTGIFSMNFDAELGISFESYGSYLEFQSI
jgi:hypothetical protein